MTIGIVIGLIVLLLSLGFVALMMVNEWSGNGSETVPLSKAAPSGAPLRKAKAAPKKKAKAKK